jgi:tRNA 2-thiouridine synthesizing protein A
MQVSEAPPEIVVEARGHRCPVPTLRLRRAAAGAAPGTVLKLLTDDALARVDAPHFAAEAGFEVLGIETIGDWLEIRIRITGAKKRRAVGGNGAPPEDELTTS